MKTTTKKTNVKKDIEIKKTKMKNNLIKNFDHLKTLKVKTKDPNVDSSIFNMNITELKKFATNKGIKNLKNLTRLELIDLIEQPTLAGEITQIKDNVVLSDEQKLNMLINTTEQLKKKFIIIVKENSQLKQLLGEYKIKSDSINKKNHLLEIILFIIIIILIATIVIIKLF